MNPLTWNREYKIALLLAIAVGASMGLMLGYFTYAISRGADGAISFGYWINNPWRLSGLFWAIFGAALGSSLIYIKKLTTS